MTEQFEFDKAAILYAENIEIVKEMEKKYHQEVNRFLDDIKVNVSTIVEPLYFNEEIIKKDENRYWWISREREEWYTKKNLVYLWVTPKSQEIVKPGKLVIELLINYETPNPKELFILRDALSKSEYEKLCKPSTGNQKIATIVIKYEEIINIQKIAQIMFDILNYLREKQLEVNEKKY